MCLHVSTSIYMWLYLSITINIYLYMWLCRSMLVCISLAMFASCNIPAYNTRKAHWRRTTACEQRTIAPLLPQASFPVQPTLYPIRCNSVVAGLCLPLSGKDDLLTKYCCGGCTLWCASRGVILLLRRLVCFWTGAIWAFAVCMG